VKKGRDLERAVRFIQETILQSDPRLKGSRCTIESNKIVNVQGVHHEIDVLVSTLPGSHYESTSIFECKDWKDPVGKNEVIILAEKVHAVRANRGFLVARKITTDAEAQLRRDTRLTFIECSDNFLSPLSKMEVFHASWDLLTTWVSVKHRGVAPRAKPDELRWKNKPCTCHGCPVEFMHLIEQQIHCLLEEYRTKNPEKFRDEGTYWGKHGCLIVFDPRDLTMDGDDIEHLAIEIQFFVTLKRKKLVSKFELKGQGQSFSFEPLNDVIPGKSIEVNVVYRPHRGDR
jgi:hypothetical protein